MSADVSLQRAKEMAVFIDDAAYTTHGDRSNGRRWLARKYGWAENAVRCLRYNQTKNIKIDFYGKLCQAFEDAAMGKIRELEHDIAEARAGRKSLSDSVVGEAKDALTRARDLLNKGAL